MDRGTWNGYRGYEEGKRRREGKWGRRELIDNKGCGYGEGRYKEERRWREGTR